MSESDPASDLAMARGIAATTEALLVHPDDTSTLEKGLESLGGVLGLQAAQLYVLRLDELGNVSAEEQAD